MARKPFIQKPYAPRIASGWLVAHDLCDAVRTSDSEQFLEDGQIEPFVFKREGEMAIEVCTRSVTRCQDAPSIALGDAVMASCRRQLAG